MSQASPTPSEQLSPRLREHRARLQQLREQTRTASAAGDPALQVAALISEQVDRLILAIFDEALATLDDVERNRAREHSAIIGIGGTGRGELAPFSDADLLFLRTPSCPREVDACIATAVRDCWDAGIRLGHSVQTPSEALAAAREDPQFATALVEARRLWGDERLFHSFCSRFQRRIVRNRYSKFVLDCLEARETERSQYGVSERQLEPDVKRSSGGLRDIHLLRWIGFAAYGTPDIDRLRRQGALPLEEAQALLSAQEFITRVRVDLHFAAGKAQEVLSREEQLRLADLYGVPATAGQRPVERFMQMYFRHTTAVVDIVARFVERHRPRSLWTRMIQRILSHRSNGIYRVNGGEIDVAPSHREGAVQSLESLLGLYQLAGDYGARLAPELAEQIRQTTRGLPRPESLSEEAAETFLTILGRTGSVGRQLRSMFSTGLLEVVLPEMSHARCLLQFNQYHSFTVDEHSLRAVEIAEGFDSDAGPIGAAYRKIKHKEILHLALLLHDLGKGYEFDHSDVGRDIAAAVAARLRLPAPLQEMLVFLVHKHLLMTHLALRRDLSDPEFLARFSRDVGSPEWLRMLYVLTAADVSAVGPTTWTSWKAELVTELYDRSLQILSGEPSQFREEALIRQVCEQVRDELQAANPQSRVTGGGLQPSTVDLDRRLRSFPLHYLIATAPAAIVDDLEAARRVAQGAEAVSVRGTYEPLNHTVEYRVITRDQVGAGQFSKMTGVLTAKGLQILSASICTTGEGIVIDRFRVIDGDHAGATPDFRLREVESAIVDVLLGRQTVETLLQRHRRLIPRAKVQLLFREPPQVVIDNDFSERFTIVEVFAHDRRGLLYTLAKALLELDLSVSLARIATHRDQVLDVFYITDRDGAKLTDAARLDEIRRFLADRIDDLERSGLAPRSAG
ncbi:MAG: [protein-PII] uridylyltransferase [Planctomycetaceae bacterium]|nr:[protein-PII] uridylyltransferase [Planctomycetaceae bacterium]